ANHNEGGTRGMEPPRMKRAYVIDRERAQRRVAADREMAVRMRAVNESKKRALGGRWSRILQLLQSIEPQLPDATEVLFEQAGPDGHVGQQCRAPPGKPGQRGQAEYEHIGANVDVVIGADTRERFGNRDGAHPASTLVDQVSDDTPQPPL